MPVYCLEHVYPLLLTRALQRCFRMGPHRAIASSVCWAQLSRGWSALRGTRLFLHSIFTVQTVRRHWKRQMFFPDVGASMKALTIPCPLHSTQGMLPGSYTLQRTSSNSAANDDKLQCLRKTANSSWSDCTEVSHLLRYRGTRRTKTALVSPALHSSLKHQKTWYTRVKYKTEVV